MNGQNERVLCPSLKKPDPDDDCNSGPVCQETGLSLNTDFDGYFRLNNCPIRRIASARCMVPEDGVGVKWVKRVDGGGVKRYSERVLIRR